MLRWTKLNVLAELELFKLFQEKLQIRNPKCDIVHHNVFHHSCLQDNDLGFRLTVERLSMS